MFRSLSGNRPYQTPWLPPLPSPTPPFSHSSATKGSGANPPPLLPTIQNHRRPPAFFSTAFPRPSTSFHFPGLCSSSAVSTSHVTCRPPAAMPLGPNSCFSHYLFAHGPANPHFQLQVWGLYSDPEAPPPTSAPSSPSCLCQPVSARLNLPYESKISGENCIYTERHYFPCH